MTTEATPQRLLLGIGITLIANFFFAAAGALVWHFSGRFSTIQVIFIQNVVSLLCILPISLRKGAGYMKTGVLPLHLIRDVFGVGSYFLYFLAIRYLNLVDAATLNYTAPFFVPLVWWVWRNEKIPTNAWYSIIIGFMGVAIILNPGKAMFQMGFIYGLFAGITSAVALSAVRVLNIHKEPMSRTLFYYFLCGSCLTAPFAWAIWDPPTGIEWVKAISIGVFTAIGQMLLTIAYRYGTASYLSPLGYMVIVYAGLISYFLFGVPLTLRSLVGTCLIVLGGTLTFIFKKKPATIQQVFEAPQAKEKPPL